MDESHEIVSISSTVSPDSATYFQTHSDLIFIYKINSLLQGPDGNIQYIQYWHLHFVSYLGNISVLF